MFACHCDEQGAELYEQRIRLFIARHIVFRGHAVVAFIALISAFLLTRMPRIDNVTVAALASIANCAILTSARNISRVCSTSLRPRGMSVRNPCPCQAEQDVSTAPPA